MENFQRETNFKSPQSYRTFSNNGIQYRTINSSKNILQNNNNYNLYNNLNDLNFIEDNYYTNKNNNFAKPTNKTNPNTHKKLNSELNIDNIYNINNINNFIPNNLNTNNDIEKLKKENSILHTNNKKLRKEIIVKDNEIEGYKDKVRALLQKIKEKNNKI